jgi:hypothetical protein
MEPGRRKKSEKNKNNLSHFSAWKHSELQKSNIGACPSFGLE